jgi:hypothetical protein
MATETSDLPHSGILDRFKSRVISLALQAGANNLPLYDRHEAKIPTPEKFLDIDWNTLEANPVLFQQLIRCYQEVFGSDEKTRKGEVIWGEGAYCTQEGWAKLVTLPAYRQAAEAGHPACPDCGANLALCYPTDKVGRKLKIELNSSDLDYAFCTLMKGNDEFPVAGFAWGAVCRPTELGQRLIDTRYSDEPEKGKSIADPLVNKLKNHKMGPVLFFDEMGILPSFRGGIDPVRFLCRDGFEMARSHTTKAMFWTSERSKIFGITTSMGFVPYHYADGLVFLIHSNFDPLLRIIQTKTEAEIVSQMRRGSKAVAQNV